MFQNNFMPNETSLFYLALVNSNQILINKRQIESATNISQTETEIIMLSGNKFIANLVYGDLMYQLLEVPQLHNPKCNR